jgi:hypothetical protein
MKADRHPAERLRLVLTNPGCFLAPFRILKIDHTLMQSGGRIDKFGVQGLLQHGKQQMCDQHRGQKVHLPGLFYTVLAFPEFEIHDTGIVNDHIKMVIAFRDLFTGHADGIQRSQIAFHQFDAAPALGMIVPVIFQQFCAFFGITAGGDHKRPFGGQMNCSSFPQSGCRPGDQDVFLLCHIMIPFLFLLLPHTKAPRTPSTTKKNIIIPQRYLRLGKNIRKEDKGHEEFFELFVSWREIIL